MSSMKPKVNKLSLLNTLVHSELHNRMQEEQDMWRKHKKLNRRKSSDSSMEEYHRKHKKKKRKKETKRSLTSKNVTDNVACTDQHVCKPVPATERWGHDGFMEHHAEEVISGNFFNSLEDSICTSDVTISNKKATKMKAKKRKQNSSSEDESYRTTKKLKKHKNKTSKHKKSKKKKR